MLAVNILFDFKHFKHEFIHYQQAQNSKPDKFRAGITIFSQTKIIHIQSSLKYQLMNV